MTKTTKNRILDYTLKKFVQNGYEKTTIEQIIKGLKISKGALYHHFSSKEQILEAIVEEVNHELISIIQELTTKTNLSIMEKLKALQFKKSAISQTKLKLYASIIFGSKDIILREKTVKIMQDDIEPHLYELLKSSLSHLNELDLRVKTALLFQSFASVTRLKARDFDDSVFLEHYTTHINQFVQLILNTNKGVDQSQKM